MYAKRTNENSLWRSYSVKRDYWLLCAIVLLGSWFRFNHLNGPGLWLDEVYYTMIAQQPILGQIFHPVETVSRLYGNDPILSAIPFSLSLRLGDANFLARFPAALFGILSVPLMYQVGRLLFGNIVGLISAFLLAVSGFHVLYSQETRSYAQLLFFSLGSFWFLYKAITHHTRLSWVGYALSVWAGLSSNYGMAFVIPVHGVFLAVISMRTFLNQRTASVKNYRPLIRSCGYFILALVAVSIMRLPWQGALTYSIAHNAVGGSSIPNFSADFAQFWASLIGNNVVVGIFFFLLCLVGLMMVLSRFPTAAILLACWLALAIPITTIGVWLVGHFFHPRFVIWVLPAFLLAAASGIVGVGDLLSLSKAQFDVNPSLKQLGVIIILLVPLVVSSYYHIQQVPNIKQSWPRGQLQSAAALISAKASREESIIAIGLPAGHIQFFIKRNRQDLIYIDESTFIEQQETLPAELNGRWYVLNNAYTPPNIPARWFDSFQISAFHDVVVVHLPESCKIDACLADTKLLLTEISTANPGSNIEKVANNLMAGLAQLNF